MHNKQSYDVVVVGAGIAGIYTAYKLKKMGLSFCVLEAGGGVGGTWFWNRYPGARCDIESTEYSYQFSEKLQQEWEWKERYASQKEMLGYLEHVSHRFDLHPHITLNTRVISATFNKDKWCVTTKNGGQLSSQFCIMATGAVSSPRIPEFDGLSDFSGKIYHTSQWPKNKVDFYKKRVAVIGTGTSGIQCIPIIAKDAEQLHVYQRTANFYVPIKNSSADNIDSQKTKDHYKEFRKANSQLPGGYRAGDTSNIGSALDYSKQEREGIFESAWQKGGFYFQSSFNDLLKNDISNGSAVDFLHKKIRTIVKNPETAEKLSPKITFGCKRLSMGKDYYETYNKNNVKLHDISNNPIKEITPTGIKTTDGNALNVDIIVFATGFNDMVDSLRKIHIEGINKNTLREQWENTNPTMYLGMTTSGFPNMFAVTGPGSPSITANMVASIEQNVDWICNCLEYMKKNNIQSIEAKKNEQKKWAEHVNQLAAETLYYSCESRYVGKKNQKDTYFMPYLDYKNYAEQCLLVEKNNYQSFIIRKQSSFKEEKKDYVEAVLSD
jgi:cyclohexanone monooxygenase